MQRKNVPIIVVISLILLSLLAGGLINILTSQLHVALPLLLVFLTLTLLALIGLEVHRHRHTEDMMISLGSTEVAKRQPENRKWLLKRVHNIWIIGVLHKSLYREARIALNLHEQPDALADPWHLSLQQDGQSIQSLPIGTTIIQVYDEALGDLLILGEPGSGKTTLLLELLDTLLERAENDETHLLPVVFNLSSWAVKRQSLIDWLIEELHTKYQVPLALGQVWMQNDYLLPLLDGLDEVAAPHRVACIEAINEYRSDHGSIPTIVCSRTVDYFAQTNRLMMQRAVIVLPLTDTQVEDYFGQMGKQFSALQVTISDDAVLRELVSTPLMLSIITLAYQGLPIEAGVLSGTLEARRQYILKTYVQRMLERHQRDTNYNPQQIVNWLHWLADQLIRHKQTGFYMEELQPDWLLHPQTFRLIVGLVFGLVFGLVGGLVFGLVDGLVVGLVFGLFFGLFFGLIGGLQKDIHPAEIVTWSWIALRESVPRILIGGLIGGLVVGLLFGLAGRLAFALVVGLVIGLVGSLVVGLGSGLSIGMLEKSYHLLPNQCIWRSARNGLVFGLVFGLVGGLLVGLVGGLLVRLVGGPVGELVGGPVGSLTSGVTSGIFFGLFGGLLVGLVNGGIAFLQHSVLRLLLWHSKSAPLRYIYFLDYAARCILLRKIGGGYIFIHHLLLDYFASQEVRLPIPRVGPSAQDTKSMA